MLELGPGNWYMNPHWSICTRGRLQSPIEIRTDRLVYDHLLGPIDLNWIDRANDKESSKSSSSSSLQEQVSSRLTFCSLDPYALIGFSKLYVPFRDVPFAQLSSASYLFALNLNINFNLIRERERERLLIN